MSVEQRDPAVCDGSNNMEGKGEMTKAPDSLQDLRRNLYVKAKAEPTWRFWGLYVHVCKTETIYEAYETHLQNSSGRVLTEGLFVSVCDWRDAERDRGGGQQKK